MQLLLDTHTLIWYINDHPRLPKSIRKAIKDDSNEIYVSLISLWELSIKFRQGKLDLSKSLHEITHLIHENGFELLTVYLSHVYCLDTLELHHKDPFDRMLIAQALTEGYAIVGCDEEFDRYGVRRLWEKTK